MIAVFGGLTVHHLVFMKLLSWNVRGIGIPEKKGRIKRLLRDRHIDVAFLPLFPMLRRFRNVLATQLLTLESHGFVVVLLVSPKCELVSPHKSTCHSTQFGGSQ